MIDLIVGLCCIIILMLCTCVSPYAILLFVATGLAICLSWETSYTNFRSVLSTDRGVYTMSSNARGAEGDSEENTGYTPQAAPEVIPEAAAEVIPESEAEVIPESEAATEGITPEFIVGPANRPPSKSYTEARRDFTNDFGQLFEKQSDETF